MERYKYYHERIRQTFNFIIPQKKNILFFGSLYGKDLASLSPNTGVGIEPVERLFRLAKKQYPKLNFVNSSFEDYKPRRKFDYIVLNGALGKTVDMLRLIKNIQSACHPWTRILVYQHNHLWQWFLTLLESLNFKRKEGTQNWLSTSDVKGYLEGAGYQITRIFRRTLFPIHFFGLGPLVNWLGVIFPFFDFLKLDQFLIARPKPDLFSSFLESLTICLTVRNEKGNIEKIVKALPKVCDKQEILFVEGYSIDGTREEIERVMRIYPTKNIRVIGQPKKGQGDAIRVGFKNAKGDIVILYEGDGTSDPTDIQYFYESMRAGRFEFIEGSRFVYPLDVKTMPFLNKIGNIFFAKWFSFFLGQRITDVLSGIKAIYKRDYNLLYDQWGFLGFQDPFGDFELLYGAAKMGLKFGEIPMRYYPRTYGKSKSNVFVHGSYLLRMAWRGYWIFRNN